MDGIQLWENTLEALKGQISKPSFDTWFHSTSALDCDGKSLKVSVENDFQLDWLKGRYTSQLEEIMFHITGEKILIRFMSKQNMGETIEEETNNLTNHLNSAFERKAEDKNDGLAKTHLVEQITELKQLSQKIMMRINDLELEIEKLK